MILLPKSQSNDSELLNISELNESISNDKIIDSLLGKYSAKPQ